MLSATRISQLSLLLYSSDKLPPQNAWCTENQKCEISSGPVVSFVNTPTYFVSPVVENTNNIVKNSHHFAEFIRSKTLYTDEALVLLDVVLWFTIIPVDLAIEVAEQTLRQNASLSKRTS